MTGSRSCIHSPMMVKSTAVVLPRSVQWPCATMISSFVCEDHLYSETRSCPLRTFVDGRNPFISWTALEHNTFISFYFILFHLSPSCFTFLRMFMEKAKPVIPFLMLKYFNVEVFGTGVKSLANWCDHEVRPCVPAPRLFVWRFVEGTSMWMITACDL